MFRTLYEFVIGLVVLLVIRAVFAAIGRMFSGAGQGGGAPAAPQQKPGEIKAEQLKQDPVCGTFVAASTAVTADSANGPVYFCSKECRKQWEQKR